MKHELKVKSTVIDWPSSTMEIKTLDGARYTIALNTTICAVMIGYPDREEKTMQARSLGDYMGRGYIIEEISFEE